MSQDVRFEKVNNTPINSGTAPVKSTEKAPSFIPIIQNDSDTGDSAIKENYGAIDYTKLTDEEKLDLISKILGIDKAELEKLPQDKTENYKKCLDAAIKHLIKSGKPLDQNSVSKKAMEYIIAKQTGWGKIAKDGSYDFSRFENSQKDNRGLGDYLGEFSPEIRKNGFANVSQEEQKRAIKAAFDKFFNGMEKSGKSHEYIVKAQLQTFGRILINSTEEERTMFKEVVKQLLSENMRAGDKAVLESLSTIELKQAYVNSFSYEDEKELTNADRYGNTITKDDAEAVFTEHKKYQSEEIITKTHEDFKKDIVEFLEKNKETIGTIKEKVTRGEELTEKEEKVQNELENFYKAYAASETAGTAVNVAIDKDAKTELLTQFNYDNYSLGEDFYRSVIDEINYIAKTNPDIITIDEKEFTELMDKISDGNYSTVLNDIENSAVSTLNPPKNPESTNNNSSNTNLDDTNNAAEIGKKYEDYYNNKKYSAEEIQIKQGSIQENRDLLKRNNQPELPKKLTTENLQTNNDYKKTVEANGLIPTIKFVFKNMDKVATSVANIAIKNFKILSNNMQADLIQGAGGKGLREMLKNVTSMAVINKVKADRMRNLVDTEVVKEQKEKMEELIGEKKISNKTYS